MIYIKISIASWSARKLLATGIPLKNKKINHSESRLRGASIFTTQEAHGTQERPPWTAVISSKCTKRWCLQKNRQRCQVWLRCCRLDSASGVSSPFNTTCVLRASKMLVVGCWNHTGPSQNEPEPNDGRSSATVLHAGSWANKCYITSSPCKPPDASSPLLFVWIRGLFPLCSNIVHGTAITGLTEPRCLAAMSIRVEKKTHHHTPPRDAKRARRDDVKRVIG